MPITYVRGNQPEKQALTFLCQAIAIKVSQGNSGHRVTLDIRSVLALTIAYLFTLQHSFKIQNSTITS